MIYNCQKMKIAYPYLLLHNSTLCKAGSMFSNIDNVEPKKHETEGWKHKHREQEDGFMSFSASTK